MDDRSVRNALERFDGFIRINQPHPRLTGWRTKGATVPKDTRYVQFMLRQSTGEGYYVPISIRQEEQDRRDSKAHLKTMFVNDEGQGEIL